MQFSILGLGVFLSALLFCLKVAGVGEMPTWSVVECFWPLWIALAVVTVLLAVILTIALLAR